MSEQFFSVPGGADVSGALSLAFELHGTRHSYPQGVSVVRQGEDVAAVSRIASGLAKCVSAGPDGSETIIALRGPGWLIGATNALLRTKSPVSVITASPCTVVTLTRQVFEGLIGSDLDLPSSLLAVQAAEIEDLTTRYGELASGSSRARLIKILRILLSVDLHARPGPARVRLQIPVKEWELAQLVAITPAHLCRLFGALERDKVLRRNKGWLEILDPQMIFNDGKRE